MKMTRNVVGLAGVAAVAFTAGHLQFFSGTPAEAMVGEEGDNEQHMQAYVEAGTPGKAHKKLQALIGEFSGDFTIWMDPSEPAMSSRGTVKREWILDGRFVMETVEATSEWGTFQGLGFIGYNNMDGQYEMVWMDSMGTGVYLETGTYDPDRDALLTRGSHRDPATGRIINTRGTLDLGNPDKQIFNGYIVGPDGREFKHFEGVTKRIR